MEHLQQHQLAGQSNQQHFILNPCQPANPAPHFPSGQGPSSTNQSPGQCPPAQLNAADLHEALEPLDANPDDLNNVPDSANDQEALCTNKIQDKLWIDIPEETQERQQKDGACILCGEQGHFIHSHPKQQ
ncbi:hypothetical protein C0989_001976, partial [Termitomyces sp. Mn162]